MIWPARRCIGAVGLAVVVLAATAAEPVVSPMQQAARAVFERTAQPLPQPERVRLLGVARAGERLVAVGERGTIVLSDPPAQAWRAAREVPTSATLTQVRFADAKRGWAVGHFGVVLRTDDGGEHWQRVLDGERSARVSLEGLKAPQDAARLRAVQQLVDDGADKPLLDIEIHGPGSVTVVGGFNTAYRSDDAGATWRDVAVTRGNPRSLHLYGIARLGRSELLVGEAGLLLRREPDAGAATVLASPYAGTYNGVLALDEQQVLVYGLRGRVYRSANRGDDWQAVPLPGEATVNCAVLLADRRIALGDQTGRVLLSDDGGRSFRVVVPGGVPVTGLVQAADGSLVITNLVGVSRLPAAQLDQR